MSLSAEKQSTHRHRRGCGRNAAGKARSGNYPQIKEYVLEHSGLKVSSLYISQIKRKCGLDVGDSYNKPKSEDAVQPQCPPEKEEAIKEALKYFGMI